jgi:uncharacterized protein (DUF58 family)
VLVSPFAKPITTTEQLLDPSLAARLNALDVVSRKILLGTMPGERRSKRRGRSVEFDDYREYVPGDDPRHIDWNVLARLDRLVVKLFREEEDLSLTILLDASGSMHTGDPPKLHVGAKLAMGLAAIGLTQQNRVGLGIFGAPNAKSASHIDLVRPMRGRRSLQAAGQFLLQAMARPESFSASGDSSAAFSRAMLQAARARAGRGVTILISDMLFAELNRAEWKTGLSYLAGLNEGHDVYCLQVASPEEIDPSIAQSAGLEGDLLCTDIESSRSVDVTISAAGLELYRQRRGEFVKAFRSACADRGIAHVEVATRSSVTDVLLGSLRRAGLIR